MLAALLLQGHCQPTQVLAGGLDHDQLLHLLAGDLGEHMGYCLILLLQTRQAHALHVLWCCACQSFMATWTSLLLLCNIRIIIDRHAVPAGKQLSSSSYGTVNILC